MPQYINKPQKEINPAYLQILEQQKQANLAWKDKQRLERVATLQGIVDNYGGIEAALVANEGLGMEYLKESGFTPEQIGQTMERVASGKIAANQDLQGNRQLAWQEGASPAYGQTAQGSSVPSGSTPVPAPAPVKENSAFGDITLRTDPDVPVTDKSAAWAPDRTTAVGSVQTTDPTGAQTGYNTYLPKDAPVQQNILSMANINEGDRKLIEKWFTPEEFMAEQKASGGTVPQVVETLKAQAKEKELEGAKYEAGLIQEQAVYDIAAVKLKDVTIDEAIQNLHEDNGGTRSTGYLKKVTEPADLARELLFDTLTTDEKKLYAKEGSKTSFANDFDTSKLPPHLQTALTNLTKVIETRKELDIAHAQESQAAFNEAEKALNINPDAKPEGQAFAAKLSMNNINRVINSPEVGEASWAALGSNVSAAVKKLQYAERLEKTDPAMYYSMMPAQLAQDMQRVKMEGEKALTKTVELEAKKLEKLVSDPEYLKDYSTYEKAQLKHNLNMLGYEAILAQAKVLALSSPKGQDLVNLLEAFTKVDPKALNNADAKSYGTQLSAIMSMISNSMEGNPVTVQMIDGLLKDYSKSIVTPETAQAYVPRSDAEKALLESIQNQ